MSTVVVGGALFVDVVVAVVFIVEGGSVVVAVEGGSVVVAVEGDSVVVAVEVAVVVEFEMHTPSTEQTPGAPLTVHGVPSRTTGQ